MRSSLISRNVNVELCIGGVWNVWRTVAPIYEKKKKKEIKDYTRKRDFFFSPSTRLGAVRTRVHATLSRGEREGRGKGAMRRRSMGFDKSLSSRRVVR